jgi:hypothetical protein
VKEGGKEGLYEGRKEGTVTRTLLRRLQMLWLIWVVVGDGWRNMVEWCLFSDGGSGTNGRWWKGGEGEMKDGRRE